MLVLVRAFPFAVERPTTQGHRRDDILRAIRRGGQTAPVLAGNALAEEEAPAA